MRVGDDAVAVLRRARAGLDALQADGAPAEAQRALVDGATERLAGLARDSACSRLLGDALTDWRDRLASYVLVAETFADMEVHPDLAEQLLRRGLDEVLEEAPSRLARVGAVVPLIVERE